MLKPERLAKIKEAQSDGINGYNTLSAAAYCIMLGELLEAYDLRGTEIASMIEDRLVDEKQLQAADKELSEIRQELQKLKKDNSFRPRQPGEPYFGGIVGDWGKTDIAEDQTGCDELCKDNPVTADAPLGERFSDAIPQDGGVWKGERQ